MKNNFPGRYWHRIDDGRIQCDLCPRYCQLKNGQRGLCFIRINQNDQIELTSYGRSSGFCIDPIEKKPLYHFLPGTPVLSFGTAGCNLACKYCQNWDISKSRQTDILADSASPQTIAETAARLDCRSVAFTYNDPVIFLEYAVDIAKECQQRNIKTVAVTASYICEEAAQEFYSVMDAVNIDLKSFKDEFYHQYTAGHLQPVLDRLLYLKHETDVWLELTTLLIPGLNDSDKELNAMTQWVASELGSDVPMHFSAFHPDYKMLDFPVTPQASLIRARDIAIKNGIHYAYTGNTHYPAGDSSWCPSCHKKLIARDWYELGEWHMDKNACCEYCGTSIAGVFEEKPGRWGARRQPVVLHSSVD